MDKVVELMKGLQPITINDFKVGNIAYVVKNWSEFKCCQRVFPVKILSVSKKKVKTVAPPINLKHTGVGYRETFTFSLVKRKFY